MIALQILPIVLLVMVLFIHHENRQIGQRLTEAEAEIVKLKILLKHKCGD